jgi:hypothetical protein
MLEMLNKQHPFIHLDSVLNIVHTKVFIYIQGLETNERQVASHVVRPVNG